MTEDEIKKELSVLDEEIRQIRIKQYYFKAQLPARKVKEPRQILYCVLTKDIQPYMVRWLTEDNTRTNLSLSSGVSQRRIYEILKLRSLFVMERTADALMTAMDHNINVLDLYTYGKTALVPLDND